MNELKNINNKKVSEKINSLDNGFKFCGFIFDLVKES